MTPVDSPDAVILHLSDLHFVGYLENTSLHPLSPPHQPKPHNFDVLSQLESIVKDVLRPLSDRAVVVVSGDLTTAGDPPAFEVVSTYLRGHMWLSRETKVGLNLLDQYKLNGRLLVVPGNHDFWYGFGDRKATYNQFFGYLDQSINPAIYPMLIGGISFLFILFDSNQVISRNPGNVLNALGWGRIGDDQMRRVKFEFGSREFLKKVPNGFDIEGALKIAVMHHHLALPTDRPQDWYAPFLEMEDAPSVINDLRDFFGVRLVLCGHRHFPFQLNLSPSTSAKMPLSCAGTASELNPAHQINSFKIYWIKRQAGGLSIEMEEYKRDGSQEGVNGPTFISQRFEDIL